MTINERERMRVDGWAKCVKPDVFFVSSFLRCRKFDALSSFNNVQFLKSSNSVVLQCKVHQCFVLVIVSNVVIQISANTCVLIDLNFAMDEESFKCEKSLERLQTVNSTEVENLAAVFQLKENANSSSKSSSSDSSGSPKPLTREEAEKLVGIEEMLLNMKRKSPIRSTSGTKSPVEIEKEVVRIQKEAAQRLGAPVYLAGPESNLVTQRGKSTQFLYYGDETPMHYANNQGG